MFLLGRSGHAIGGREEGAEPHLVTGQGKLTPTVLTATASPAPLLVLTPGACPGPQSISSCFACPSGQELWAQHSGLQAGGLASQLMIHLAILQLAGFSHCTSLQNPWGKAEHILPREIIA